MTDPNPLVQADPSSLNELFSRDPEGLQEQDIVRVVAELRRMRVQWTVDEAAGKKTAKKSDVQKKAVKPADINIKLEDLGL